MLVKYLRADNKLVGCVVAIDNGSLGWSFCNPKDTFKKDIAKKIAAGRAEMGVSSKPPHDMQAYLAVELDLMHSRSMRYFK